MLLWMTFHRPSGPIAIVSLAVFVWIRVPAIFVGTTVLRKIGQKSWGWVGIREQINPVCAPEDKACMCVWVYAWVWGVGCVCVWERPLFRDAFWVSVDQNDEERITWEVFTTSSARWQICTLFFHSTLNWPDFKMWAGIPKQQQWLFSQEWAFLPGNKLESFFQD